MQISIGAESISWEANLTFVGAKFDFLGNDGAACNYRTAQAEKVWFSWAGIFKVSNASMDLRCRLLRNTVFSSALWTSQVWNLTKKQCNQLDSWAARIIAKTFKIRKHEGQEMGFIFRRLRRVGHHWMQKSCLSLNQARRGILHDFAGHLGRKEGGILALALRTRSLAWRRWHQSRHQGRHDGLRPKRFKAWRWEQQLVDGYGNAAQPVIFINEGCLEAAADRASRKASRVTFCTLGV